MTIVSSEAATFLKAQPLPLLDFYNTLAHFHAMAIVLPPVTMIMISYIIYSLTKRDGEGIFGYFFSALQNSRDVSSISAKLACLTSFGIGLYLIRVTQAVIAHTIERG